jgi:hypothetical protein
MAEPGRKLIEVLLDRLYATLVNGPLMSCRPHSSRQRVDLLQLGKMKGPTPPEMLAALLGKERSVKLLAADLADAPASSDTGDDTRGLIAKLRTIAEDARTYEEDTGTQALFLGFPLLNVPPESGLGGARLGKRVLAPLAFIPLNITIKAARAYSDVIRSAFRRHSISVPKVSDQDSGAFDRQFRSFDHPFRSFDQVWPTG